MRILQLGRFWNDQHGGIERHVALLSRGLAAQGADVTNLVASADLRGSDTDYEGYRLVQAPSFGKAASTAISPALVGKALAMHVQQAFDVIHLHLPDPLSHLVSMVMPGKAKRVITWHSDIVKQKHLLRLYEPWQRALLQRSDAVVAATHAHFATSSQIPADLPPTKLHVIPYGIDASMLTHAAEQQIASIRAHACGKTLFFALGRHVYYKGFDVLLQAMRSVDGFLILGGDGEMRASLELQAQQIGVAGKVLFAGRIPEAELVAYFHACDVFCLPSVERSEAFGLVQLEAMACGKPVINTGLDNGVNEVSPDGETGLTVPVRDAQALGAAMNRLAQDPGLRELLGGRARQRALGHYSMSQMTERHMALYKGLLAA